MDQLVTIKDTIYHITDENNESNWDADWALHVSGSGDIADHFEDHLTRKLFVISKKKSKPFKVKSKYWRHLLVKFVLGKEEAFGK